MSTKAKIQKVRAEVEAHEERGWLKGYEEGLAKREQQIVDLQSALEVRNETVRELSRQKNGPRTAREALALAWELAHPVKEGYEVPIGTECISKVADGEFLTYRSKKPFDGGNRPGRAEARTLDPLPDPEPDWLDAPAVVAFVKGQVSCVDPQVFARANKTGTQELHEGYWRSSLTGLHYHWTDLIDTVPLYPRADA